MLITCKSTSADHVSISTSSQHRYIEDLKQYSLVATFLKPDVYVYCRCNYRYQYCYRCRFVSQLLSLSLSISLSLSLSLSMPLSLWLLLFPGVDASQVVTNGQGATSILKSCSAIFVPIIASLANLSFIGVVPSSFKLARVSPLLRKAGLTRDEHSNCRQFRTWTQFRKYWSFYLALMLLNFCASANYNRLHSNYWRAHSTETAILKILNDVYQSSGSKNITLLAA